MKRLFAIGLAGVIWGGMSLQAETEAEFEARLVKATDSSTPTVVHIWASWCYNCIVEFKDGGWPTYIKENPEIKFIFISTWGSDKDDVGLLGRHGINTKDLPNLEIWRHPNESSREGKRAESLLGVRFTWMPTTWVVRDTRMRYAINYGEVRFDMLDQMIKDSRSGQW